MLNRTAIRALTTQSATNHISFFHTQSSIIIDEINLFCKLADVDEKKQSKNYLKQLNQNHFDFNLDTNINQLIDAAFPKKEKKIGLDNFERRTVFIEELITILRKRKQFVPLLFSPLLAKVVESRRSLNSPTCDQIIDPLLDILTKNNVPLTSKAQWKIVLLQSEQYFFWGEDIVKLANSSKDFIMDPTNQAFFQEVFKECQRTCSFQRYHDSRHAFLSIDFPFNKKASDEIPEQNTVKLHM